MYEGNNEGGEDSEGPGEKGVGLTVLVGLIFSFTLARLC